MKKLILAGLLSIGVASMAFADENDIRIYKNMAKQANTLISACNTQSCKNFITEIKEVSAWLEKAEPHRDKDDEKSKTKDKYYTNNAIQVMKKACASFKKLDTKDTNALAKKIDYEEVEDSIMKTCPMIESGFADLLMGLDSATTGK
ncbi:hypothetical protein XJ32_00675 [Helicobacter bilis]|uniref:Uncharacterized protein n=1 Tax=Helicobacter bilis TaxID=37372 RepID=A0A1Q2LEL0_9HELI|nr:hypothetical protein [Helicobacter bilis]AQQ58850.1 hypothetical protein XJ32_00675 [Helicobacter bilis]